MKPFFILATAFILPSAPLFANPVAGEGSDLKPDTKALFGSMDNGFNYIIYPNAEPPGKFSVRLHIAAGSLMEEDNQRGLAHFLEHMVFNGTKNFTPAELIPKMQRLGIQFGAHANAYTSFDETVYMLDLPNLDEETKDLTFTVMRDFADGALLTKEEIDKERGVIISEKNSRDSVGYRMMLKQFEYLLPGSRLMQRVPIGTEEVINSAPRERFTDFYNRYYTPERMTFIVVGDIDPQKMEKQVRETFISLSNPENPGKNPPKDVPPSGHGLRAEVFADKEIPADSISLYSVREYKPTTDTSAKRISEYPLSIANSIITRRFEILSKKENSVINSGQAGESAYFEMIKQGGIDVSPKVGKWKEAVPVMEQELRRVVKFGFTQAEVDEAKAKYLNWAEEAVKRKDTRRSPGIASELIGAIGKKAVFTTPEADLELTKKALKEITPEACLKAFNQFWNTKDISLVLTTNEKKPGMTEELKELYLASTKVAVEAPKEEVISKFAYTDFGEAGTVTSTKKIEDFNATQLVLSNNVRVNYKKTDFQKNSISINCDFGSGQLGQPDNTAGLDRIAAQIIQAGGLVAHSEDELQRILAGKNVGVGFGVGEASFSLSGRTTPEDLELQLQLMCAYLTDPGFRPEAERQFKAFVPMIYQQIKHSMNGAMIKMGSDLHGGDFRYDFPPQEQTLSYTTEQVKNWLLPEIKNSPMEVTLVGDLDPEVALPLILKTFGALPDRKTVKPDHSARRKINFPARPGSKVFKFDSKIPNAAAIAVWKIPAMGKDVKTSRRLNILSAILSDRMREEIREKLGGSYSPRAGTSASEEIEVGMLRAMAEVQFGETKKYGDLMIALADKMARDGVTQDELERALKPIESSLKESLRDNNYWLNTVLGNSQEKPYKLNWARTRDEDYGKVSVDELNALARKYLIKGNALLYELIPESSEEPEKKE